jgi:predicted phage-related endonuclease
MLRGKNRWELANVDFFIVEPSEMFYAGEVTTATEQPENITAILECKTTGIVGRGNAIAWDNNQVPASYYWQGAHYAMVTDIPQVYFACLIGGQGIVVRSRDYTAETLVGLRNMETAFWELVEKKSPPDFTGADAEFEVLKALYPSSTGTSVEVDEFIVDCLSDYRMAKREADEAEEKVKAARIELEAAIADADEATWNGQTLYTYKSNKVGEQFDTKRFKEENPELWAQYVTERKGARVLRLKGE